MHNYIFLFLFFTTLSGFSQAKEFKLSWDENKPLTWSDFLAEPNRQTPFSATTNSGISYSWSLTSKDGKDEFVYEVRSNFYPNLSWVKGESSNSYLLAHEQLHFDISELHARKFRKAIQEYKISKNIKQELREIYYRIEAERQEMQNRYDAESNHSLAEDAEEKWQKFVKLELKKYNKYAL